MIVWYYKIPSSDEESSDKFSDSINAQCSNTITIHTPGDSTSSDTDDVLKLFWDKNVFSQ